MREATVTGIKKDLTEADKALAKLKADHAKEPEVVKQIALIEKHHAKAHEVCGMAEEPSPTRKRVSETTFARLRVGLVCSDPDKTGR